MKSYIKLGVIFLPIIQILCGCSVNDNFKNDINEKIEVTLEQNVTKTPYTGYIRKDIELSTYEPGTGAYLGAYVLGNPELEFDIRQFEKAVGKNMAIGLRHYQLGDPFPDQWLLECLANKKAPQIVITPNTMSSPYDRETLEETAQKFKDTYGMPVFIEFYPGPKEFGDPARYIAYFQLAKEVFAQSAPNVVFVWSMDMEDVYDSMIYYPGDDYVDWIGISMYFPVYKGNMKYKVDVDEKLSYFYNMYKDKKPMMISKLAVSHYSKEDHTFYIAEARDIINQIYSTIPTNYPRIKAINYIDINNIKIAPKSIGSDNFRVSTEPKVTKVYKEAIKNSYFLENVEEIEIEQATSWGKMRSPIYEWEETLYVLEETIAYDFGMSVTGQIKKAKVIIGGSEYYDLKQVVKSMDYKLDINEDNIRIYK